MAAVASDFNLQKLNTKELSDNLRATIDFGGNVVLIARRGSGKTTIAKQCIKESGCKEMYMNLSVMERCDFGYPDFGAPARGEKYVSYLFPAIFKPLIEGNTPVVALLDEVDKAESSLLAPILEFTQFHTMNGVALPNLRAVIMTGNLQAEGGQRPTLPLLDRAEKFLVEASHHHWLDWAAKTGRIHPSITAYISDHPEDLFGDVDPGDVYADPSPRGWENSSKLLYCGEEKHWGHRILTNKVAGCIGKKTGIKYSSYFEHYTILLPIIEKIMKGDEIKDFHNLEQSRQMVACMIVCSRLSRILDDMKPSQKELPKVSTTVGKFLSNVDPEMALISIRSQIGLNRAVETGLDETPIFDKLLRDVAKRING
jgi:hypothetical protein